MLRTQIYLPAKQLKFLKKKAWEEEISLSETIRKLIEEKLIEEGKAIGRAGSDNVGTWLISLAAKAKQLKISGPKNLASKLDSYLYDAQ